MASDRRNTVSHEWACSINLHLYLIVYAGMQIKLQSDVIEELILKQQLLQ